MSRESAKTRRASNKLSGFKMQPRDERIVWFVGSHGYATMPQIKLFAFEDWDNWDCWNSVSDQTVYRRLGKLCDIGFLIHERTWYGDHGIYRATRAGLALAELDLAPARLDRRDYDHDLRVVDLTLKLTDYTCEGWITERLIRSRIKPGESIGRVPDGLLVGQSSERWAVELEISGKDTQRYSDACNRYADRHRERIPDNSLHQDLEDQLDDYIESGGEIDGVVWYFFSEKKRQRALSAAKKVIADRDRDDYGNDHLHFRFHNANSPMPPPFDKWEEQEESDLREAERLARKQRETAKQREKAKIHAETLAKAKRLLTQKEQDKAMESAYRRKYEQGDERQLTVEERERILIDAMMSKRQREQKKAHRRQRTKEAIRNVFGG